MNFVLDYLFHAVSQLISHGVQKLGLLVLLSFGQRTHRYELLNEPLVSLA